MGRHETITERILAEAHARPQVSVALMDTLLPAARADIQAAFNHLVASGELVAVGTPGLYRLREAWPDPHTLLTLLAARPRTLGDLIRGVRWKEELVREAVDELIKSNLVTVDLTKLPAQLSCTPAGLSRCGWAAEVRRADDTAQRHPNGGPPPPRADDTARPNEGATRRERLAETFAPVVLSWVLANNPYAMPRDAPVNIAARAYELADAFIAAGRTSQ